VKPSPRTTCCMHSSSRCAHPCTSETTLCAVVVGGAYTAKVIRAQRTGVIGKLKPSHLHAAASPDAVCGHLSATTAHLIHTAQRPHGCEERPSFLLTALLTYLPFLRRGHPSIPVLRVQPRARQAAAQHASRWASTCTWRHIHGGCNHSRGALHLSHSFVCVVDASPTPTSSEPPTASFMFVIKGNARVFCELGSTSSPTSVKSTAEVFVLMVATLSRHVPERRRKKCSQ
jgi:hypothetical protein